MKHPPPRLLSLAAQVHALRARFPDGCGTIKRGRLIWEQSITPHPLAGTYHCRLNYAMREYPHVSCLHPQLSTLAGGRTVPHVYRREEPVEMCLFMRQRECWGDTMSLARVVMPLAYFWLAHFEEWLFSGVWRGGGTHETRESTPSDRPAFPPFVPPEFSSTFLGGTVVRK